MKKPSGPRSEESAQRLVDVVAIDQLAKVVAKYDLTEVEIDLGEMHVRVARDRAPAGSQNIAPQSQPAAILPAAEEAAAPVPPSAADELAGAVRSPMVGTAYLRPNPESQALRRSRLAGEGGRQASARRSDEDVQRHCRAAAQAGHEHPRRRWRPGRIRPAAVGDRVVRVPASMFDKILIANRGEIALAHHARREGARHRDGGGVFHRRRGRHACQARRRSVCIGPPPARDSYLNVPAIVAACEITGADAVHPGYGFLAENARFADILDEHDIAFIGPRPEHIRVMGDKIEAKRTATRLGIPCVPGSPGALT